MAGNRGKQKGQQAMNDEIGNFLIKFTTEGFDKVEKSLDALNKNMEKLDDSFEKGSNKGESFFGALLKWDIVVGTITKSFRALRNEITDVFNVAEDMTTLFRKEQILGTEAKVLERYGWLSKLNQGSQQDAYAFFEGLQSLMLKASTPALWSESDAKDLALAGINWSYNSGATVAQNRDAFLVALRQAFLNNMGNDARMSYLKKYVPQESIYSAFMAPEKDFRAMMDWAESVRVISKEPERLQDVQDLRVEKLEWESFWQKLDLQLTKPLADLYKALEPLQEPLEKLVADFGKWVSENSDKIAGWVEDAAKWVAKELPKIVEKFADGFTKALEIISNIYDWMSNKGVIGKTWDSVKMVADAITGVAKVGVNAIVGDDVWKPIDEYREKYSKDGEGGYLGSVIREMDRIAAIPLSQTAAYSTTNNYGSPVTVKAGTYPNDIVIQPRTVGPTGAMLAGINKG